MPQECLDIMELELIRREFGLRLKRQRKGKRWTQKELAAKLGIGFSQVNKYECGLQTPPMDKLLLLAELFDVSLDYLLMGEETDHHPLHNRRLLERFRALQSVEKEDQETVIKLIDAMIAKHRMEKALTPLDKKAV